jgi:SET domain-containing protein
VKRKSMALTYGPFPRTKNDDFAEKILEIKQSSIPNSGLGVFAKEPIAKGTAIGRYSGLGMNQEALDKKYGTKTAEYGLTVTCSNAADCGTVQASEKHFHKVCIDAVEFGNWACRINDGPHSGLKDNVAFGDDGTVYATKNIRAGEELLTNYGSDYW